MRLCNHLCKAGGYLRCVLFYLCGLTAVEPEFDREIGRNENKERNRDIRHETVNEVG